MTIAPCAWASSASSAGSGASMKPVCAEVRRMDAQDDPGPAVGERRLEVRRRACGSSSPPRSAARRPAGRSRGSARRRRSRRARRATTATPPPRPASPTASATAAALLLVTSASSAPVSATRCVLGRAEARPAPTGRRGRARGGGAAAAAAAASIAAAGQGARPRLVWMITPVALIARSRPDPPDGREAGERPASAELLDVAGLARPPREPLPLLLDDGRGRPPGSRPWLVPVGRGRGSAPRPAPARRSGVAAGSRSTSGPPWRERMGVEPTARRRAPRHSF